MSGPGAFKELMKKLDPTVVALHLAPILMASQSFPLVSNTVGGYAELLSLVSSFYNYLFTRYCNVTVDMPPEFALHEARKLLRVDNFEPFYDQCVRGTNGGVASLLAKITERYYDQAEARYVDYIIDAVLSDPLDYETIDALMTEYVNRFGQYLGYELRSKGALCMRYRDILRNHASVLSTIRSQVGQI